MSLDLLEKVHQRNASSRLPAGGRWALRAVLELSRRLHVPGGSALACSLAVALPPRIWQMAFDTRFCTVSSHILGLFLVA
jgi:hypothetical protein